MDVFGLECSREFTVWWWPKINDPVHAISPIWNTSRAFGTHILRFDVSSERPTLLELALTLAVTLLRIYMIYIILVTDAWDLIFISSSQLVEKGLDLILKSPFALLLFVPWLFLILKRHFSHISHDIASFDALISQYNYPPNYQFFHFFSTILTTAALSVPLISLTFIRGFDFWMDHFIVMTFVGFSWSGGLLFYTICNVLLFHILHRLEIINNILKTKVTCNQIQENARDILQLIKTIMRLHDKLSDIANSCSRCFGFPIVVGMIHVVVSQLLTTFAFIRVVFYHYNAEEMSDCIFYTLGTTSYCCVPIIMIWIAGHIKQRTIVTWKLVHRIINTSDNIEVGDLLQQFSEQMNHRSPRVNFFFFDVDWPLLVKACSEAATYLIIMIQFETKQ